MAQQVSHRWRPISDLPDDYGSLTSSELRILHEVWLQQKDSLEQSGAMQDFLLRLQRQWAIETGVIERVYTLDRGITQVLIEKGIDASFIPSDATDKHPELVARIIQDHQEVVEGIFQFVKGERCLTTSYIKELHAQLTRHQTTCTAVDTLGRVVEVPLVRGRYKELPNNPQRADGSIHEYCPPEHVASETDRLVTLHLDHVNKAVPPEIEAAWLHHAFSQIHPFQDGNGRIARALASLIFIKAGWLPLTVTRDDRDRYISALEEADRGNLKHLVDLFSTLQRATFVKALGIAGQARQQEPLEHVIVSARELLDRRRKLLRQDWTRAKDSARALQELAAVRFEAVAGKLREEIGPYSQRFEFRVDSEPPEGMRNYYFRGQVIETAKDLGYSANTGEYHGWLRLLMRTEGQAELLLSFHAIGCEFRGLLAASMCFFRRETTEHGDRQLTDTTTVSSELFQINYREALEDLQSRFEEWLNRALVKGLEMWRAGL